MDQQAKIYVAGHRGLVGSAIVRNLQAAGYSNLLLRTHGELELMDNQATRDFFLSERWRLRGTAGAENAGDILFTLRFD